MKFLFITFLITMIIPFHSCSVRKDMSYNQRVSGHYQLYSYPDLKNESVSDRYKRLVLVSLNDLNGAISAQEKTYINTQDNSSQTISWGGVNGIKAYLDIFRTKFPNQVLLVDSGSFMNVDHFHEKSIFLHNYLGVNVANLGINEFSLNNKDNLTYLQNLVSESNFPIVSSNLVDLKTNNLPQWKNLHQSYIVDINGLKVGVIGLFSPDLATKVKKTNLTSLYFQNLPKTIIQSAANLRRTGAKIIITLINSGIDCSTTAANNLKINPEKLNFIPETSKFCDLQNNEVHKALLQIPMNTIDAVITGNHQGKVANLINRYPVMQNFGNGQYLSWMELYYDTKHERLASERTIIYQPVKLCHQFFEDTQDCYTNEKKDFVNLIPAKFMKQEVELVPIP